MKKAFFGFILGSFALSIPFAEAALIEGHFYAMTCGQNQITSQVLPMDRQTEVAVSAGQVCQGTPVEIIRIELLDDTNNTQYVDFHVTERSLFENRKNLNRTMFREVILAVENPQLGRILFKGEGFDGRMYSLKTLSNETTVSAMNIQVSEMTDMVNIALTPNDSGSVLRNGGDIDVWNPRK